MSNQLGWVQISKAWGARRAAPAGAGGATTNDRRACHAAIRGSPGHVLRRVFRPGRTLMLIALVAVTIVSWAVKAGATPQSTVLAPSGSTATGGRPD